MKILLAVDGSEYTKKMLAYLAANDTLLGTDHQYVLFTVQAPIPPRARAALGKEIVEKYYAEESEKVLKPVSKFLAQQGITPKTDWKVGNAGELIAKLATSGKFDLLVMGSHGHGTLGNLILGSVATKVLAHCAVPVLIVR
ncbi:universal stress protein [Hylemonella gracilis]|uniref:Uspa domain-containing protein n=1 Tax=Hylemonella gracilis ATCC 19624 TaxID=887062 RepID=F3KWY7_9BURK|nr:universal stress protein [Hylemonella gracilis]EGI75774.1 uspa domain-containing protein [Hylemonella gracilis ATCC 19624]